MKRIAAAIIALGWACAPASEAQQAHTPTENVVVTAPRLRPDSVIRDFVVSHAVPAPMLGKIARWKQGVCPLTAGVAPGFARLVTRRVRQIAAMAGAPVEAKDGCRINIEIVFTTEPQALLDDTSKRRPELLGYYSAAQVRRIGIVSHAIQAWYATETEDWNGIRHTDDPRTLGMDFAVPRPPGPDVVMHLPSAHQEQVRGNRLGDGLSSELYHVLVVVDRAKVEGYEIGPLADYIAMLALSQTASFDACQDAPSITNLIAPDCDARHKTEAIADFDLAYLKGLYGMELSGTLQMQRSGIADRMRKELEGR